LRILFILGTVEWYLAPGTGQAVDPSGWTTCSVLVSRHR